MTSPHEKFARLVPALPARAAWLDLPCPAVARIAAGSGIGLGVIDREHGAIGIETAAAMTAALALAGMPALVRVADGSPGGIQQALDAGAAGVIVPCIESAAAARMAAAAVYYPPQGRRGFAGGVIAATGYGRDAGYGREWNDRGLLVVQIESRRGLAAMGDIAAVDGVDMLFFGPFDYAMDAGLDPGADGAALAGVLAEIVAAARAAGRLAGAFPWPGMDAAGLIASGADLAVAASDIALLRAGFDAAAG